MPDIVIAFFALGLCAGLVKSDLKLPSPTYDTLAILLMLVLGLKGGMALHGHVTGAIVGELLVVATLGVALPLLCYPVLRRLVRLDRPNALSIAAHYGSVSAGTFAVALALAEHEGLAVSPQTTLYLVMLELPAIVVMLWLHHRRQGHHGSPGSGQDSGPGAAQRGSASGAPDGLQPDRPGSHGSMAIWREAFTSRGVVLLGGGVLIGALYGPHGMAPIAPVMLGGFKAMLAIFLLEMGLCTARVCRPLPLQHWRLMVFAAVAPFVLAWAGIAVATVLGLPPGTTLVLAALTASASYIAAPAAIRAAIPQADIGLAMLAALGITFPVNVLLGLPLYRLWLGL